MKAGAGLTVSSRGDRQWSPVAPGKWHILSVQLELPHITFTPQILSLSATRNTPWANFQQGQTLSGLSFYISDNRNEMGLKRGKVSYSRQRERLVKGKDDSPSRIGAEKAGKVSG